MNQPIINSARRGRRTAQQWQDLMRRYESSGLTQEAFCAQENLAPSTFHSWRARFREDVVASPRAPRKEALPFVELRANPPAHDFDIELEWGGGIVLRMRSR